MRVKKLIIKGFRCFDDKGATIKLDDFTCFIGPNAAGKTAAMLAIVKLFGETASLRQVASTDFHLGPNEKIIDKTKRELSIECYFDFPELINNDDFSVPEVFNQMCVENDGEPYCRVRLSATWIDNGTVEGDISQRLEWVLEEEAESEGTYRGEPVDAHTRAKISIAYIPSVRNPEQQIRSLSASGLGQILKAVQMDTVEKILTSTIEDMQNALNGLKGVQTINAELQNEWAKVYDGYFAREVYLQALEENPLQLLKMLAPYFYPGEGAPRIGVPELSDGLRSLFSISLTASILRIQQELRDDAVTKGFESSVSERLPMLTILALEEPENHLSPHYLGKIINEYSALARDGLAQVIISSHSPAILSRVKPDNVRYFLGNEIKRRSRVKKIPLPSIHSGDEAFKFVREALQGYPELYFSRLVILGEGPSEEILLRKIFEISGYHLDINFISIVPLGGRHVNHFWRLLDSLKIPYLTLLDMDLGKEHGGWARVQYIRDQLVKLYAKKLEKLEFNTDDGETLSLADATYEDYFANKKNETIEENDAWLNYFEEKFSVFFSRPLDIDFAMIESFLPQYKAIISDDGGRGPNLPPPSGVKFLPECEKRMRQVLSSSPEDIPQTLLSAYSNEQKILFPWYKYLFVEGSKPATHMRALLKISESDWLEKGPSCLKSLIDAAKEKLGYNE